MVLDIDNISNRKYNCYKKNMVWENKGIVLGIMYYLINNRKKFVEDKINIIVPNGRIRRIIKEVFNDLNILDMDNGSNLNFHINIKSIDKGGLIINNLKNIKTIHTKRIYLLPYYDPDNPIIMYNYNPKYTLDIEKIRNKIDKFTNCDRGKIYGTPNFITIRCKMQTWDPYVEYRILRKHAYIYRMRIDYLYRFISSRIMDDMCIVPRVVPMPVNRPVPYPVRVPTDDTGKDVIISKLRESIEMLKKSGSISIGKYNVLLKAINDKVKVLNDFMEKN